MHRCGSAGSKDDDSGLGTSTADLDRGSLILSRDSSAYPEVTALAARNSYRGRTNFCTEISLGVVKEGPGGSCASITREAAYSRIIERSVEIFTMELGMPRRHWKIL